MLATRMVATSIGSKSQQQRLKQLATSRRFYGYQRLFNIHGHHICELSASLDTTTLDTSTRSQTFVLCIHGQLHIILLVSLNVLITP